MQDTTRNELASAGMVAELTARNAECADGTGIGHDRCMDAAGDVVIRLSRDEALMLFEILHRWEEQGRVAEPEHHAEQIALWNLSCMLESELAEVFDPAWDRLIADARMRLAGRPDPPGSSP